MIEAQQTADSGGDAAFENVTRLTARGCTVHLLMRSVPRTRRAFYQRVADDARARIWPVPTTIERIEPMAAGGARLPLSAQGIPGTLEVRGLFVRIGVEPQLPDLPESPARDEEGYLITDMDQRTSIERLWAIGDVSAHPLRGIVTSAGAGARAALSVARELGAFDLTDLLDGPPPNP